MEAFYTLSQLAITIAGFAALFSILKIKDSKWSELDKLNLVRFYVMIELACIIAAFCFLPIIFSGYLSDNNAYRLSFALFFILSIVYHFFWIGRSKRISGKANIGGVSSKIIRLLGNVAGLFAIVNAIGLIGFNYKSNYLALMFLLFIMDLYVFIRLIYFSIGATKKNNL